MPSRVLVVDDSDLFRRIVSELLRFSGFLVTSVSSADHAIASQHTSPADILVTDLVMPVKDGIQLIEHFKRVFPNVPVVAVSANIDWDCEVMLGLANKAGADHEIEKSDISKLVPTVLQLLAEPKRKTLKRVSR